MADMGATLPFELVNIPDIVPLSTHQPIAKLGYAFAQTHVGCGSTSVESIDVTSVVISVCRHRVSSLAKELQRS
jgi:hypothetical protein